MKKLLSILFLCTVLLTILDGQHILKGTVSLDSTEVAQAAIIRLLSADTSRMFQFAESDAQGNWSLETDKAEKVLLEFSYFGYASQFVPVDEPQKVVVPFDIVLKPQSFNLDAVTVEEKAFGVRRSGDTLSFRLETYTTGAERTLGDVLKRLPGMEIRDGSVFYGGEKITRMLVQGRDIINSNQQLATEGIRADQLQEIKIIENYKQPSQQFQTEQSEDVAMDVRLKEGVLNKWSGQADALGGYPGSGKLDANGFNLNEKVGISAFARGNNVGERVLTYRDLLNMISGNSRSGFWGARNELAPLLPDELNISDQVQANTDGILNLNLDWDATEGMKIKGFIMGAYAERESEVFMERNFVAENKTRTEVMTRNTRTPIANTFWRMEWNIDSTTYLEVSIPATVNTSTADEQRTGDFSNIPFNTSNEEEELSYSFTPYAQWRKKVGKDDIWSMNARYQNIQQDGDLLFEDIFPFLGVPLASTDSIYRLMQSRDLAKKEAGFNSNYKWIMGNWFVQPGAEYSYRDQILDFGSNVKGDLDFDIGDRMIERSAILNFQGGYETKRWEVIPGFSWNYLSRNFRLEDDFQEWFPGATMRVVRKFNRAHNLRLTGSYGIQYPEFSQLWGVNEVNSATEVSTGAYPFDLATKGYSASVNYRNFIVKRRTFIFANVTYNYNEDVITNFTQSFGDYIVSGFLPTPESESLSARAFFGYELPFFPIRIEPSFNYNWNSGFSANGNDQFATESERQAYGLEFESRWDFPLNVELGMDYAINTVDVEGGQSLTFESWEPSIELEYRVGRLTAETDFSYDLAGTRDLRNDLYLLDFGLQFELKDKPFSLLLEANNVLNLDPRERVRNTFGLNVTELRRYQVFPGFILAGVQWRF